jgi:hypothetical protein
MGLVQKSSADRVVKEFAWETRNEEEKINGKQTQK